MTQAHTPRVNARYWTAILLASVCGTNLGDLYAHESGLGIGKGLALLALLAAAVFGAERYGRGRREVYYWAAILLIRTGATNIADYLAYRVRVPAFWLVCGVLVLLMLFASLTRRDRALERAAEGMPATGMDYWLAMLCAGVFGTVVGDLCENAMGDIGAMAGLLVLLGVVLAVARGRAAQVVALYWTVIAVARTAGTAVGDLLSESKELHLGLWPSTALSGAAFLGVLVLWKGRYAGTETMGKPRRTVAA